MDQELTELARHKINPKVIDLYHADKDPDWEGMWEGGIRGVIHKASEGIEKDPKYAIRRNECFMRTPDMLWGAYHFGRPGDVNQQVKVFLSAVAPGASVQAAYPKKTVLVLDHEDPKVPLWWAQDFLSKVKLLTGKIPWLYSGFLVRQQEDGRHAPAFSQYPLWLPEYGIGPRVPYPWKTCILWQYTDGHEGQEPHTIKGVEPGLDISSYDGTDEQLRASWYA